MKPPLWIRITSCFFIFIGVVTAVGLGFALANPIQAQGSDISIGLFSKSFSYAEQPRLFIGVSILMILAGATGLTIVTRWRHAYDLAIIYSILALLFFGISVASGISIAESPRGNALIPFFVFGAFLFYLVRNRNRWLQGQQDAAADSHSPRVTSA